MSRRRDDDIDWVEQARRQIDDLEVGRSGRRPGAATNRQDPQTNKWNSYSYRRKVAEESRGNLKEGTGRRRDSAQKARTNLDGETTRHRYRDITESALVAKQENPQEERADSRACNDQAREKRPVLQMPFKVTRAVPEKSSDLEGVYRSKLEMDPSMNASVTTRSVTEHGIRDGPEYEGLNMNFSNQTLGGTVFKQKEREKKEFRPRKDFYMSKLEIEPGMDFKVAKSSADIQVKEDPDDLETLGEEKGHSYDNIIKINSENKSQVIFSERIPTQMHCGQDLCALLNNNKKRGVLVVGVSDGGIVRGVMMDRKDKDLFRQSLDTTLSRMEPINPLDDNLVLSPVFKPVKNHPSRLRDVMYPGTRYWETGDKTPMTVEVEVKSPPEGRPSIQFKYDGHVYKRTEKGTTVMG